MGSQFNDTYWKIDGIIKQFENLMEMWDLIEIN